MFDICPSEEVGDFEVKATFMGVEMEKVQLHFQVNISQLKAARESPLNHDDGVLHDESRKYHINKENNFQKRPK